LVTGAANTSRSSKNPSGIEVGGLTPGWAVTSLFIGVDGTGSAKWLSKVDAQGNLVNQRTRPDGTTAWNSHVRNLVEDCKSSAMTIYSPGPAWEKTGYDASSIQTRIVAKAESLIRASGGGINVAVAGHSRGGPIGVGVANALANPPAGSPARAVAFVGLYDPVDMSPAIPASWSRIDPTVKNVTIVGPASGKGSYNNLDYPVGMPSLTDPVFIRMSLENRITVTGTATTVSRISYDASHGSLGGLPGFNKNHSDQGPYNYTRDVDYSIRADRDIRNGMRAAGFDFVPKRPDSWYGFPGKRPPADLR